MAETSFPWGGTIIGDHGPYDHAEWQTVDENDYRQLAPSDLARIFLGSNESAEALLVTPTSPASAFIQINGGAGAVKGVRYFNTTTAAMLIAANGSANPRIDRVVLRIDYNAQVARLALLQGTPAATPAVPALTQIAGSVWEVGLARIAVASAFTVINAADIMNEPHPVWSGLFSEGRLSLSSSDPNPISNISGATSIHYLPAVGNRLSLYKGQTWRHFQFDKSPTNVSLSGLGSGVVHDLLATYANGRIEYSWAAWASTSARAQAISRLNGVYVLTSAPEYRVLGTIYTSAAGQTASQEVERFVWNMHNRKPLALFRFVDITQMHTYNNAAARVWNNNVANRVDCVLGLVEHFLSMGIFAGIQPTAGNTFFGIGHNTGASSIAPDPGGNLAAAEAAVSGAPHAVLSPALGLNTMFIVEKGHAGNPTFLYAMLNGTFWG